MLNALLLIAPFPKQAPLNPDIALTFSPLRSLPYTQNIYMYTHIYRNKTHLSELLWALRATSIKSPPLSLIHLKNEGHYYSSIVLWGELQYEGGVGNLNLSPASYSIVSIFLHNPRGISRTPFRGVQGVTGSRKDLLWEK